MMASVAKESFSDPDWIFETKLDGFRAIAVIDSVGRARLWSRNRLSLEPKFPMVLDAVDQLKLRSTILDGEIVALDAMGIPRFQLLQKWQKRPTAPVVLYLFDVLWSDGRDLTCKTVPQRREHLEQIITPMPGIQVGGYIENRGKELFALAKEKGLEGTGFSERGLKETIDRLKPLFTDKPTVENPPDIPEKIQCLGRRLS